MEEALLAALSDARVQALRPVVIVGSYDETVRVKHLLARAGAGFGVAVETFDGWVEDLWELFGDGRALVASLQRRVLLRRALEDRKSAAEDGASALSCTSGYARLLERAARECFAAAGLCEGMSPAEQAATRVVLDYGALLAQRQLVEQTEACRLLLRSGALEGTAVVVLDVPLSELQLRFLEGARTRVLELSWEEEAAPGAPEELSRLQRALFAPDFENPVLPEGHVRFAFPEGEYAAPRLIAHQIESWFDEHPGTRVALAAPDSRFWFERLAPRLANGGVTCGLDGAMPFGKTLFGSAWCALLRFAAQGAREETLDVRLACDFALSAFSGLSPRMARVADSRFRGSRAQTVDDAFTDLAAFADEDHRDIAAAFAEGDYLGALSAERDWVASRAGWPSCLRDGSLAAISCAERVHAAASDAGLSLASLIEVLETVPVDASAQLAAGVEGAASSGDSAPTPVRGAVDFLTLPALSQRPAATYDCIALVDLTAAAYPLSDEPDSADALLDAWGAGPRALQARALGRSDSQRMQKAFSCALAAARERIVIGRPLNNHDGDEERPSALLEELIDCYRRDPQNSDEIDRLTGLTPELSCYLSKLGEDDAAANLACGRFAALSRRIPLRPTGAVLPQSRERILLPRVFAKGMVATKPYLSPSAIESYLECPYLWFARRRLRLDQVDADFGGLAMGNFAHGVLEQLHRTLRERGMRRVSRENVEDAVGLANSIFDERFEREQFRFAKDALIPLDELERMEVRQLRRHLEDAVRREARLLPDFAPLGEEIAFGEGDDEFMYAGVNVTGKVDRIDVDAYGRAVVIDYKGSVGPQYAFRQAKDQEVVLPRKMQTLIYAQMARRKLGLIPVGAIYYSYGKDGQVQGLFDRTVLDGEADLLGMKPERCGTAHFADALDAAEEEAGRKIARLLAGDIAPAAVDLEACRYCPVALCECRDELRAQKTGGDI